MNRLVTLEALTPLDMYDHTLKVILARGRGAKGAGMSFSPVIFSSLGTAVEYEES